MDNLLNNVMSEVRLSVEWRLVTEGIYHSLGAHSTQHTRKGLFVVILSPFF